MILGNLRIKKPKTFSTLFIRSRSFFFFITKSGPIRVVGLYFASQTWPNPKTFFSLFQDCWKFTGSCDMLGKAFSRSKL